MVSVASFVRYFSKNKSLVHSKVLWTWSHLVSNYRLNYFTSMKLWVLERHSGFKLVWKVLFLLRAFTASTKLKRCSSVDKTFACLSHFICSRLSGFVLYASDAVYWYKPRTGQSNWGRFCTCETYLDGLYQALQKPWLCWAKLWRHKIVFVCSAQLQSALNQKLAEAQSKTFLVCWYFLKTMNNWYLLQTTATNSLTVFYFRSNWAT